VYVLVFVFLSCQANPCLSRGNELKTPVVMCVCSSSSYFTCTACVSFSFDVGPLLLQAKFAVPENCTTFQLRDYLIDEGCTMVCSFLNLYLFNYLMNCISYTQFTYIVWFLRASTHQLLNFFHLQYIYLEHFLCVSSHK